MGEKRIVFDVVRSDAIYIYSSRVLDELDQVNIYGCGENLLHEECN